MGAYLNRIREGKKIFDRMLSKVEELEAVATSTTKELSDMPRGGQKQNDDAWASLVDYKLECMSALNWYLMESKQLEEELTMIRNTNIRVAMLYRYVDCYTIDKICDVMHFDRSWVFKLLDKGRAIYDKEYGWKDKDYE